MQSRLLFFLAGKCGENIYLPTGLIRGKRCRVERRRNDYYCYYNDFRRADQSLMKEECGLDSGRYHRERGAFHTFFQEYV